MDLYQSFYIEKQFIKTVSTQEYESISHTKEKKSHGIVAYTSRITFKIPLIKMFKPVKASDMVLQSILGSR